MDGKSNSVLTLLSASELVGSLLPHLLKEVLVQFLQVLGESLTQGEYMKVTFTSDSGAGLDVRCQMLPSTFCWAFGSVLMTHQIWIGSRKLLFELFIVILTAINHQHIIYLFINKLKSKVQGSRSKLTLKNITSYMNYF